MLTSVSEFSSLLRDLELDADFTFLMTNVDVRIISGNFRGNQRLIF